MKFIRICRLVPCSSHRWWAVAWIARKQEASCTGFYSNCLHSYTFYPFLD